MKFTKTELEERLKAKEKETAQLRDALKKYEMYEGLEEAARTVKMMQDSFINAGFTQQQAFELTKSIALQAMTQFGR